MTLIELLKESASKNGSKRALQFKEKNWSYEELYEKVIALTSSFDGAGIKKGDRVALYLKNSPEFIWTVFALSALGAITVPINFFLKNEEVQYILENSGASAIVTQSEFLEGVKTIQKQYAGLKKIWVTDIVELGTDPSLVLPLIPSKPTPVRNTPLPTLSEEDTILILYTSGTTGKSKGAMLSHKNLTSNALASIAYLELTPKDKFICLLPMFHVFAWMANVLIPIHLGCTILIIDSIRPPKLWLKKLSKEKITVFAAVPQVYALLAQGARGFKKWVLRYFFRTVRLCISGAAPLNKEVAENFEKSFKLPVLEGYGLSETSPVITVTSLKEKKVGSVGKTIPNVKIKIIDELGKELLVGEEGEICVRGPNVMEGYYGMPEETKLTFTPDGWLKTGDVGKLDRDGFLTICDRIKDMIIVKGLKVFSAQVEQVFLSHPKVAEAAVIGVPTSNGDEIIKAFIVPKENMTLEKQELFQLAQEKLAAYKRPRDIELRTQLPKNALQKVLKRELRNESLKKGKVNG